MTRTRTARHPRPCASCRTPIRRGEVYRATAIPPRSHDILYFETWAHLSDHVHCPEEDQRGAAVDEYTEHLSAQVAALTTQREA